MSMFARGANILRKREIFAPATTTGTTGRGGRCPHRHAGALVSSRASSSSSIRSYSSAKNEEVDDDLAAAAAPPQVTVTTQTAAAATTTRPRKRHRHRFSTTEEIPSFHEFQLQQRVRSLYRKFTRLVTTQQSEESARRDLQNQIRREFRLPQQDSWHVKRSVSEGNRRFKELSAMLGSSLVPPSGGGGGDGDDSKHDNTDDDPSLPEQERETTSTTTTTPPPSSKTGNWPWNNNTSTSGTGSGRRGPMPFPPKSNV